MVKVLVVDDSPLAREMITTILNTDSEINVIGQASNGREAIEFLKNNPEKPDIITCDIQMPIMNGFEAIEHIMAYNPTPILIVTVLNKDENFMKALKLGALDIIQKPAPDSWIEIPKIGMELIEKVKLLSRVNVVIHLDGKQKARQKGKMKGLEEIEKRVQAEDKVVGIASSTGGPTTLLRLFKTFEQDFPAPVLVVQHMSEGFFIKGLIDWFKNSIKMPIKQAEDGETIENGCIYISPINVHLKLKGRTIVLDDSPPIRNQKPSADLLFETMAEYHKENCIAIVLTGIGEDGAGGIKRVKELGGLTIAQDQETSTVFGMPKAAIDTGCVDKILPLEEIGHFLNEIFFNEVDDSYS
ncbi:MAG: chemotaxis-specific protein-glutamate methyltransferase CheB [Candidatus Aureabacteria bacterium]|nr:chemotaxis-specific protein-glutamate methyltransferase CheB [Candidatus Auribacterota bacterium]